MRDQKEKFARLPTLEMGKRIAESGGEVELSASILQYYPDHGETFLAPRPINSIAGDAYIEYLEHSHLPPRVDSNTLPDSRNPQCA